jgi:hypothetical protein
MRALLRSLRHTRPAVSRNQLVQSSHKFGGPGIEHSRFAEWRQRGNNVTICANRLVRDYVKAATDLLGVADTFFLIVPRIHVYLK